MRYFTLSIFIAISLSLYSQNTNKRIRHISEPVIEKSIVSRYTDSLRLYKSHQDSILKEEMSLRDSLPYQPVTKANPRFFRLFSPLYFYPELARRQFSFSPDEIYKSKDMRIIDRTLMNVYIQHPEFVKGVSDSYGLDATSALAGVDKKIETVPTEGAVVTPKAEEKGFKPIELVIRKPNFWHLSGDFFFQTMQNYYSKNWYQGGESNYSLIGRTTLRANYNNKQKIKWDNTLEMQLGFQTNKSDTVHSVKTSTDLLRYTGKFGVQATKKWYYTLQLVASSQFMRSYASNSNKVNSDFLSPLNVNISIGMDYNMSWFKNKLTGSIHLAPLAFDYKYVDRVNLAPKNGIDEGRHSKCNYGSTLTFNGKWVITDNIIWNTRLYGFTSYKFTDVQWENTFNLKISKLISMSIYVYPRFEDSNIKRKDESLGYFQLKEYTSVGLTYSF